MEKDINYEIWESMKKKIKQEDESKMGRKKTVQYGTLKKSKALEAQPSQHCVCLACFFSDERKRIDSG